MGEMGLEISKGLLQLDEKLERVKGLEGNVI